MKIKHVFFISAFIALVLVGCQAKNSATPVASEAVAARPRIAEGRLMPRTYADLAFSTGGRVAEVLVAEGEPVTAGQVLARLELVNLETRQAELARAEQEILAAQQAVNNLQESAMGAQRIAQAQFDLASLDQQIAALQDELTAENDRTEPDELLVAWLNAQIGLLKAQAASIQVDLDKMETAGIDPAALEAAQARLVTAQSALAAAQVGLQPVELKAPWAGTLASLDLVVGQSVTSGLPVATLADFSEWVVKTDNLTEIEVVGLQVGQEVGLTLDALPEVELTGKIEAIRSKYEEKRGDITYTVTIGLDTLDSQARWGMTVAVKLGR